MQLVGVSAGQFAASNLSQTVWQLPCEPPPLLLVAEPTLPPPLQSITSETK